MWGTRLTIKNVRQCPEPTYQLDQLHVDCDDDKNNDDTINISNSRLYHFAKN